jgi:hypothetical protein
VDEFLWKKVLLKFLDEFWCEMVLESLLDELHEFCGKF